MISYGDLMFLGGGSATRQAKAKAVKSPGATGQSVLDAVINAALTEGPPG
jgi:hypothetical protein